MNQLDIEGPTLSLLDTQKLLAGSWTDYLTTILTTESQQLSRVIGATWTPDGQAMVYCEFSQIVRRHNSTRLYLPLETLASSSTATHRAKLAAFFASEGVAQWQPNVRRKADRPAPIGMQRPAPVPGDSWPLWQEAGLPIEAYERNVVALEATKCMVEGLRRSPFVVRIFETYSIDEIMAMVITGNGTAEALKVLQHLRDDDEPMTEQVWATFHPTTLSSVRERNCPLQAVYIRMRDVEFDQRPLPPGRPPVNERGRSIERVLHCGQGVGGLWNGGNGNGYAKRAADYEEDTVKSRINDGKPLSEADKRMYPDLRPEVPKPRLAGHPAKMDFAFMTWTNDQLLRLVLEEPLDTPESRRLVAATQEYVDSSGKTKYPHPAYVIKRSIEAWVALFEWLGTINTGMFPHVVDNKTLSLYHMMASMYPAMFLGFGRRDATRVSCNSEVTILKCANPGDIVIAHGKTVTPFRWLVQAKHKVSGALWQKNPAATLQASGLPGRVPIGLNVKVFAKLYRAVFTRKLDVSSLRARRDGNRVLLLDGIHLTDADYAFLVSCINANAPNDTCEHFVSRGDYSDPAKHLWLPVRRETTSILVHPCAIDPSTGLPFTNAEGFSFDYVSGEGDDGGGTVRKNFRSIGGGTLHHERAQRVALGILKGLLIACVLVLRAHQYHSALEPCFAFKMMEVVEEDAVEDAVAVAGAGAIGQLQAQLDAATQAKEAAHEELARLATEMDQLHVDKEQLQVDKDTKTASLRRARDKIKETERSMQAKVTELTTALDEAREASKRDLELLVKRNAEIRQCLEAEKRKVSRMTTELADKEDRSRQAATRSDEAIRKQREVQLAFDKTAALIAHKEAEIERQKQTCESLRGHVAQLETTTASALSLEFERDGLKQLAADLKLQRDQLEALRKDMDKAGEQRDDAQRKLDATAKEVGEQRALVEAEKAELRAQLDRVEAREAALNAADDEKRQAEVAKLRRREQKIAAARADLQHRLAVYHEADLREYAEFIRRSATRPRRVLPSPPATRTPEEQRVLGLPADQAVGGSRFCGTALVPLGLSCRVPFGTMAAVDGFESLNPRDMPVRVYERGMTMHEYPISLSWCARQ